MPVLDPDAFQGPQQAFDSWQQARKRLIAAEQEERSARTRLDEVQQQRARLLNRQPMLFGKAKHRASLSRFEQCVLAAQATLDEASGQVRQAKEDLGPLADVLNQQVDALYGGMVLLMFPAMLAATDFGQFESMRKAACEILARTEVLDQDRNRHAAQQLVLDYIMDLHTDWCVVDHDKRVRIANETTRRFENHESDDPLLELACAHFLIWRRRLHMGIGEMIGHRSVLDNESKAAQQAAHRKLAWVLQNAQEDWQRRLASMHMQDLNV